MADGELTSKIDGALAERLKIVAERLGEASMPTRRNDSTHSQDLIRVSTTKQR